MEAAPGVLRTIRHAVIGVAVCVIPIGCAMSGYQAPPVSPALARHSRVSTAVLERGFIVHQAKCAKCHVFENPANYTPDELRHDVMPTMARKAKLDAADELAVLEYLLAARRLPPPVTQP